MVTADSTYLVMVIELDQEDGTHSYAWTHGEYEGPPGTPELVREKGHWKFKGAPLTGNVHSLAPATEDRHSHRREPIG